MVLRCASMAFSDSRNTRRINVFVFFWHSSAQNINFTKLFFFCKQFFQIWLFLVFTEPLQILVTAALKRCFSLCFATRVSQSVYRVMLCKNEEWCSIDRREDIIRTDITISHYSQTVFTLNIMITKKKTIGFITGKRRYEYNIPYESDRLEFFQFDSWRK